MVDADFNFKMPKIEMTEQSEDGKYGRFVVELRNQGLPGNQCSGRQERDGILLGHQGIQERQEIGRAHV